MPAPELTFRVYIPEPFIPAGASSMTTAGGETFKASLPVEDGHKLSPVEGHRFVNVTFSADIAYTEFECRATKAGASYGRGQGRLVAAFSYTPAATERTFEIYDTDLVNGDGGYRIGMYAQSMDGGWNDNTLFIPAGASGLITSDGRQFLCMR